MSFIILHDRRVDKKEKSHHKNTLIYNMKYTQWQKSFTLISESFSVAKKIKCHSFSAFFLRRYFETLCTFKFQKMCTESKSSPKMCAFKFRKNVYYKEIGKLIKMSVFNNSCVRGEIGESFFWGRGGGGGNHIPRGTHTHTTQGKSAILLSWRRWRFLAQGVRIKKCLFFSLSIVKEFVSLECTFGTTHILETTKYPLVLVQIQEHIHQGEDGCKDYDTSENENEDRSETSLSYFSVDQELPNSSSCESNAKES